MTHRTEIAAFSSVPRGAFFFLAALLFSVSAAYALADPYIADIFGERDVGTSAVRGGTENGELRFLGAFKIFNPDAVPFYLWVTFDNGGKFALSRSGGRSAEIRLMDLELRYRDMTRRPVVKAFPKEGVLGGSSARHRRSAWGASSGGAVAGRFGKKKPHERPSGGDMGGVEPPSAAVRRRGGAVEIAFWREDAQPYYEIEVWGVLYAPDVQAASAAGRYIEKISFEIEPAR